jgi:predicted RND superfamily exporter protein
VIALSLLITVIMLTFVPSVQFEPDVKKMIPDDFPAVRNLDILDSIFGGSEIIVVAVESESIFTPAGLKKFASLETLLGDVVGVERVISLYSAKEIIGGAGILLIENLMDEVPETLEGINSLKETVAESDLVYESMVSKDFDALAFFLRLGATSEVNDKALRDEILGIIELYNGPENIYLAGLPITRAGIVETMQSDMKSFMPYGILLMIFLLALSFRSWMGVFLPLSVVIMSIIWTLGLMSMLGIKFTMISILIPVMLIAVANDYGIHIIAHYFENFKRKKFTEKDANIRETIASLNKPIFLAGITTIVGLMSLLGHFLPPAKELGLLAGFGVFVAFTLSLTFIPAALKNLRIPPWIAHGGQDHRFNRFLQGCGRFFVRFKRTVMVVAVAGVIIAGLKIPTLRIDTDPIHYYREGSEIRVNNERISEDFGGSSQLSIIVTGDIKEPATLRRMKEISLFLEQQPAITRTLSIVDQVELLNEAWHDGDPAFRAIPEDKIAMGDTVISGRSQVAQLLQFLDEEDVEQLVQMEENTITFETEFVRAQIIARINRISSAEILELNQKVDEFIETNYSKAEVSPVTGSASIMGTLTDLIARGQLRSLAISLVLVFLVTSLVFRSFQAGLYCVFPLGGAVILVFGFMAYFGIELNTATSMLTSILIGVGIDYTIHFLWHYRQFVREGMDAQEAVIQTLTTSGKGIIFNAFSVMVGFIILMVSGFLPIFFFGFVIIFSIGMCLIGALALLPALVVWTKPRFIFGEAKSES